MTNVQILVSATIVGFFTAVPCWASPLDEVQLQPDPKAEAESSTILDENMVITEAPTPEQAVTGESSPNYYIARQSLALRLGQADGQTVIGFLFQFPKFLSPKFEAGADALEDGDGHIHLAFRWVERERKYFRYSYKAAVDHFMEPKDGLATFASLENYYARGGVAIEYTVWNPYSLRLELEALANIDFEPQTWITLAFMRGW